MCVRVCVQLTKREVEGWNAIYHCMERASSEESSYVPVHITLEFVVVTRRIRYGRYVFGAYVLLFGLVRDVYASRLAIAIDVFTVSLKFGLIRMPLIVGVRNAE